MTFTLALCQKAPVVGDKDHNLTVIEETLDGLDADLAVFPELFLPGYLARDQHRQLAEPLTGPSVARLSEAAAEHGTHVVTGMALADPEVRGLVYNAAVHVGPGQEPTAHRKTTLPTFGPFEEDFYFGHGTDVGVVETPFATLGLNICYELFFPEVTKAQALQGADVLVNISASPTVSKRYFEALVPARAIETTCFLAYCNLVGQQDHLTFWGGSRLVGPRGNLEKRADYYEEEVAVCEVDLRELPSTRALRPVLRDTQGAGEADRPDVPPELAPLAAFHGRVTPWGVVGFRLGVLGLELAASPGEELTCEVVAPDDAGALLDGLQVASGCTLGRGTLAVREGDDVEARFQGTREATVRLTAEAAERVANRPAAPEVARSVWEMDVKELFEID